MMEMRAAGGTRAPLMLDWLMWLSMPNVNAEWENPASGGKEKKHISVQLSWGSPYTHSGPSGNAHVLSDYMGL